MTRFLLSNRFVVGIVVASVLAFIYPEGGAPDSWLRPGVTTKIGVFAIFLLQGMILPAEELLRGMAQWRVHLFTQSFIFLLMPLVTWMLASPFESILGPDLTFGFLFLGILPCTISTAVVFTARSGGATTVALFNTSLSNVAGIFIVPAFYVWWMDVGGGDTTGFLVSLLGKIVLLLLVPLVIGMSLRPVLRSFIERYKSWPGRITPNVVYFITYVSFAQAILDRFWERQSTMALSLVAIGVFVLTAVSWAVCGLLLRALPFERKYKLAAFFCGTQKTVAAGVPMAQSLFNGGDLETGVVLLPLLFYSLIQLSLGGLIVGRFEHKKTV